MNVKEIIVEQIDNLTDFDISQLSDATNITDVGLVSLDYVAIQVALKREMDIDVDLNKLAQENLESIGDLVRYVESL
ncbi:phosphopantetheine-binding protein [Pantoea anthophila]|uniref:phosphopantetheine-binding protein n=1 Tax=Pantoea anthophila TaxID=470931 RepID=UPI002DB90E3D|nr:phosphopantetheine-binding protein [Pantoea anthophila]MEB5708401.1 acyl carrier protein [Pantoea anthophila]MEB6519281.1 acyl carrier protein [Pantoea anthophila]